MKIGVVFPQTEIGQDQAGIREFAQAAEQTGYDHLGAYEHVLGANPGSRAEWRGPYTHKSAFHEPFVLFGYLAAVTSRIGLVTDILILPQRQTALVAKQAAEVDLLSGGRLRLGIGIGWNHVEYEALGQEFSTRGRRMEEQVHLLRALWTQELVTFHGRWDGVTDAGINPLPVQRPIPIWMGGGAEPVLERIARVADGWFPQMRPDEEARGALARLRGYIGAAGRDPSSVGIEASVGARTGELEQWVASAKAWEELGATHLFFNTLGAGFSTVDQHVAAIRRFKEAIG